MTKTEEPSSPISPAANTRRRFRNRVLLYLLFLSIPPLLIWGYFAYTRSLEFVSDYYERELLGAAKEIALRIQWAKHENATFARYLALELQGQPRAEWPRITKNMTTAEPLLYSVHVIGRDGVNLARGDGRPFMNYADRLYFQNALEGKDTDQMVLSRVYDNKPAVCSSSPIREKPNQITAVIATCRFINQDLLQMASLKLGRTSSIFIADRSTQKLVFPHLEMRATELTEAESIPLNNPDTSESSHLDFTAGGENYVSFRFPLGDNWYLVAVQQQMELNSEARQFMAMPALVGLFSLFLALLAGILVIDRSTRPLLKLTAAAEQLGPGNLDIRVPVESRDEIGILAKSFNSMADRLSDAFSRLRENEHQLNQNNEELEQKVTLQSQRLAYSTKMSSLGEMAGSIAHEVNNPLAIISLRTQKLREQIEKDQFDKPVILETLEKIEKTCLRINQIIRGLRAFSRDGSHDPMVLENLSSIVHDAIALCVETARNRGVELRVNCPESIEVECQPVQIGQVLLNLLNNARDAAQQRPKDRWIEVGCGVEGQNAVIRITDSGAGVPPELREKIMQPFFTTKQFGEGTGLGLSISKGILEQHHGSLRLDPEAKRTCFVVRLPLRQPH